MNVTRCRSCGAAIIWTTTAATGRKMPVDETPSPGGAFLLEERGRDVIAHHVKEQGRAVGDGDRYHSHFATCPNATDWRKP